MFNSRLVVPTIFRNEPFGETAERLSYFGDENLLIRRDLSPPEPWVASLNFHAGFDVEHGLGVLTNGVEILGIGYSADATRFKR